MAGIRGILTERRGIEKKKRGRESKVCQREKRETGAKEKAKEAVKLDRIYNSLSPLKKKEAKEGAIKKLPPFWKERLKKEKGRAI